MQYYGHMIYIIFRQFLEDARQFLACVFKGGEGAGS